MASSGYYKGHYDKYCKEIKKLEQSIKALKGIKDDLLSDFSDEQGNVNKELNDLETDLKKAVKQDGVFIAAVNTSTSYTEKGTTADGNLSNAVSSLENEIAELENKKRTAENNRDSSWNSYQNALAKERQEALKKLQEKLGVGGKK